jgi:hypothetical protein
MAAANVSAASAGKITDEAFPPIALVVKNINLEIS